MYWLKCCPRCHGDLYDASDTYGSYIACAQCGYHAPDTEAATSLRRPSRRLFVLSPRGNSARVTTEADRYS